MNDDAVKQAIAIIKSGDKASGQKILAGVVSSDSKNEAAWMWLSVCVEQVSQKKFCLNRVLAINPNNQQARQALSELDKPIELPVLNQIVTVKSQMPPESGTPHSAESNITRAGPAKAAVTPVATGSHQAQRTRTIAVRKSKRPLIVGLSLMVIAVFMVVGIFLVFIEPQLARQQKIDSFRAIELAKEKTSRNRNEWIQAWAQLAMQAYRMTGGSNVSAASLEFAEDWTANITRPGEYSVSTKLNVVGGPELVYGLSEARSDWSKICPGSKAEFTVILDTATVMPTNGCAKNLIK